MAMSYGWARALPGMRSRGLTAGEDAGRDREHGGRSRLLPILLALYLTPALLLVLLVGGLGMLVVAAARALPIAREGPGDGLTSPIGPDGPPA